MWIPLNSTMPVGLLDQHHHTISRYPVALLGFVLYCFSARRSSSLFLFIMSGMAAIAQERGGYWQDCLHIWIHAAEGQHGPMGALQVTWTFCRWGHLLNYWLMLLSCILIYFDVPLKSLNHVRNRKGFTALRSGCLQLHLSLDWCWGCSRNG